MHFFSRRLQGGAHNGDDRALGVGAGDMDDGWQGQVRVAKGAQQPDDPVQRQVDQFWVQPRQSVEDGLGVGLGVGHGKRLFRCPCATVRIRHGQDLARRTLVHEQRQNFDQGIAQLSPRRDDIDHAVV